MFRVYVFDKVTLAKSFEFFSTYFLHERLFAPLMVSTAWDIEEFGCGHILQHISIEFNLESCLHQVGRCLPQT